MQNIQENFFKFFSGYLRKKFFSTISWPIHHPLSIQHPLPPSIHHPSIQVGDTPGTPEIGVLGLHTWKVTLNFCDFFKSFLLTFLYFSFFLYGFFSYLFPLSSFFSFCFNFLYHFYFIFSFFCFFPLFCFLFFLYFVFLYYFFLFFVFSRQYKMAWIGTTGTHFFKRS